jgi:hypothetical protein
MLNNQRVNIIWRYMVHGGKCQIALSCPVCTILSFDLLKAGSPEGFENMPPKFYNGNQKSNVQWKIPY